MTQVTVTDIPRRELSEEEKTEVTNRQTIYGMYGGELMTLQLQFDNKLIDVVMDRFGEKTICHKNSDNTFYINEEVQVAPTFWGWLFQFGSQAKVLDLKGQWKWQRMLFQILPIATNKNLDKDKRAEI